VAVWPLDTPANTFAHSLLSSLGMDRNVAGNASPTPSAAIKTTLIESCLVVLLP